MSRLLLYLGALAIGVISGLLFTWYVAPVSYVDTEPHTLRAEQKTVAVQMVIEAYAGDHNVERARERLLALGETDPAQVMTALAQRTAASGGDSQLVRVIAELAVALGNRPGTATSVANAPTQAATPTNTPIPTATTIPTETPLPTITPIPLPTAQPSPTPIGSFVIASQQVICDPALTTPRLQVITQDNQGNPVAGVAVVVEWNGGRNKDRFFTGLKPEFGAGYGDFEMQTDITYTIRLATDPSVPPVAVFTVPCTTNSGQTLIGSPQIIFRQP